MTLESLLPEERIRQALIKKMVEERGFPRSLLVVEKKLSELPHLKNGSHLPNRRLDLCAYYNDGEVLHPLLLVECKEGNIGEKALDQVVGYNDFVQAPYLGLAGKNGFFLGSYDTKEERYFFKPHLPTYQELITWLKQSPSPQEM